jgi:1,4-dihydroxy-2-naphthoate octaprenyltransferase
MPVVWTVPMALLVSAILHANNWRDSLSDRERGVRTMASLLGDRGSQAYYGFLIFAPFVLVLAMILAPRLFPGLGTPMPWTFLVVLTAFPQALRLWGRALRRRAPRQPLDFVILDGATANFNLTFGLLCTLALWLNHLLGKIL